MYFHWQNLNDHRCNNSNKTYCGSGIRHGRCWIRPSERSDNFPNNNKLQLEWGIGKKSSIALNVGLAEHDYAISLHAAFLFCFLYLSFNNSKLKKFLDQITRRKGEKYGNGRTIGFQIYEEFIWINLWKDDNQWGSKDPWWWQISLDWKTFLLGKQKHSVVSESPEQEFSVTMPEGDYKGKVVFKTEQWKRPRWFADRWVRAHADMIDSVPFPGKGESDWDCGQDALHGVTTCASTVKEVSDYIEKDILKTRRKYGGKNWKPEK